MISFFFLLFLNLWANAITIKTTMQVLIQCPHMLRKPRLDTAPSFSSEVKDVIGSEACKLVGDVSCESYVSEYPFDGVEFRRRLEDYENMYVFVSLKLSAPLGEDRWMDFQANLMSASWLKEVTSKTRIARKGACTTLSQASYPQQSGDCWSFDRAVNASGSQPYHSQNEFCSIRLTHQNAHCAIIMDEDGTQRAKRVSIASFDELDCANKVADDTECGSSFSWNRQNGVCICSMPGYICNGEHASQFGDVYIFRSGNFGYFGFEDEESEEQKKKMEEEQAKAEEEANANEEGGEEEANANEESVEEEQNPSGMLHKENQSLPRSATDVVDVEQNEGEEQEETEEAEEEEPGEGHGAIPSSVASTSSPGRLARTPDKPAQNGQDSGSLNWLTVALISFLCSFIFFTFCFIIIFKREAKKHNTPLMDSDVEPIIL